MPEPGPGEVLVRVHACGICGTDLWMAHGVLSFREFPLLMGHEGVGEVVALGAGVTERKIGDRVGLPMMQKRCGACGFCREEHPDSFVTAGNCAGPTLTGVNVDGALAEYAVAGVGGRSCSRTGSPTRMPRPRCAPATRRGPASAGPTPGRGPGSPSSVSAGSATSRSSSPGPPATTSSR
ncbi:alcohol dehydrogenase catalytic domain-containing protein [Nonomuraea rubra]